MFGYKKGIESSPEGSFSTSQTTPSSRANVDDLIRGIPFPEGAVSEFHSVRWKHVGNTLSYSNLDNYADKNST